VSLSYCGKYKDAGLRMNKRMGGGLGDFGFLAAGMEIAWQCEIDHYCQKILALRYPESKKYTDIKTLKGADLEQVDIITGGFPCQPFSNAGSKMGKSDDRHLWPEMFRIIQEVKPHWVVGENVSGFVDMALDDVCANLESAGYETTTLIFPAHALGAWHERERCWIIANSNSSLLQGALPKYSKNDGESSRTSDSIRSFFTEPQFKRWGDYRGIRKADGCTNKIHRLKMLGNGQVPACTYVIGKMIMEIENKV
jgi:DNA (cytosine-5)-methyltransferase 1